MHLWSVGSAERPKMQRITLYTDAAAGYIAPFYVQGGKNFADEIWFEGKKV